MLKGLLKITAAAVLLFGTGVMSYSFGLHTGMRGHLDLSLEAEAGGTISGHLAIYKEARDWSGEDIANAICATRSQIDDFHQTYALSGSGLHFLFSCAQPGKET